MQNIIIYYFSATGNTLKIAKLFSKQFEQAGASVTLSEIKPDSVPTDTDKYDLIGFAYPVHGFRTPEIVTDMAKKLPVTQSGTKVFAIKSSGEPLRLNDGSYLELKKIVEQRGYSFFAEYHYVMPYNMVFRHTDGMARRMLNTAEERIPAHAAEILKGTENLVKVPLSAKIMSAICLIERPGMKLNGRFYHVNSKKCVNCMACVKNCPVQNISYENGKFKFGWSCIGCARCAFNCPKDAITAGLLNVIKVNGRYNFNAEPDYNVPAYCHKSYIGYFDSDRYGIYKNGQKTETVSEVGEKNAEK